MTTKLKIREYLESDLTELEEIILNGENFGIPFLENEKRMIQNYSQNLAYGRVFVAEDDSIEKILGYITVEIRWGSLNVMSIIVHHNYLRKGVGRKLVDQVKKLGEKLPNITVLRVDTGDFMSYAQHFYLACGFQPCGFVSHDISWFNHQVHFAYPLKEISRE